MLLGLRVVMEKRESRVRRAWVKHSTTRRSDIVINLLSKRTGKRFIKSIAWIVTLSFLFSVLAPTSFNGNISLNLPQASAAQTDLQKSGAPVSKERRELTEKRSEKSRTFINPDHSYTTEIYERPINFKNSQGKYESIDNTLVSDPTGQSLTNKANDFSVKFAAKSDAPELINYSINGESISLATVKKADGAPGNIHSDLLPAKHQKIGNNKLFYPEIYPGIDLFYGVGSDRVKEDIVIKNRPIPNEATGFSFKFHAPGLTYEKLPDGSIVFKSRMNGQPLFLLAKPFMYDSSIPVGYQANPGVTDVPEGSRSDAVSMDIVQRGSNFFMTLFRIKPGLLLLSGSTR